MLAKDGLYVSTVLTTTTHTCSLTWINLVKADFDILHNTPRTLEMLEIKMPREIQTNQMLGLLLVEIPI